MLRKQKPYLVLKLDLMYLFLAPPLIVNLVLKADSILADTYEHPCQSGRFSDQNCTFPARGRKIITKINQTDNLLGQQKRH